MLTYDPHSNYFPPVDAMELNRQTMQPLTTRKEMYLLEHWRYGWQRFGESGDAGHGCGRGDHAGAVVRGTRRRREGTRADGSAAFGAARCGCAARRVLRRGSARAVCGAARPLRAGCAGRLRLRADAGGNAGRSGGAWRAARHTLADAARLKQILAKLAKDLGDPVAVTFTGNAYCETRRVQLDSGVKGKTLNNRLGYLKAVFNELHRLGEIDYPNPLINVRPLRLQERPLSFLSVPQINEVLAALDARDTTPGIGLVARVCLATGARWGEAQALTPERVKNGAVTFANTKARSRAVSGISAVFWTLRQSSFLMARLSMCFAIPSLITSSSLAGTF